MLVAQTQEMEPPQYPVSGIFEICLKVILSLRTGEVAPRCDILALQWDWNNRKLAEAHKRMYFGRVMWGMNEMWHM